MQPFTVTVLLCPVAVSLLVVDCYCSFLQSVVAELNAVTASVTI